ncbi:MAG TPA: sugar ABC transporter permease [Methylomirabilota bacterium]|jgi:trehalose transport system permease protein|nr:sugar ABC transporter permease [Methylomirabilota bacterium]
MPGGRAPLAAGLKRHRLEVALAFPLFAYVLVLTVVPILDTIRLSLTAPFGAAFPSLASYRAIFESEVFHRAVLNTVAVTLLSITLQIAVGLGVALALHREFPLRALVRTVMLMPLGVPTVVAGAVMLLIFSRSGYLNSALFALADLVNRLPGVQWRFEPLSWAVAGGWRTLLTLAIADMWKVLPMVTLIFLAGLESIPPDVYEAADVDGAGRWPRFARVTLPLLAPYLTMAIILRAIDAFRIFELALVLAGRVEPVLGTFIWSRYGPPTSDVYTAAAASIVLFALIMVFIVAYLRLFAGRVEIEA